MKDLRSLQRKLEETLVLLVKKQKDSTTWEAPQLEVAGTNETLQQVCLTFKLYQIFFSKRKQLFNLMYVCVIRQSTVLCTALFHSLKVPGNIHSFYFHKFCVD